MKRNASRVWVVLAISGLSFLSACEEQRPTGYRNYYYRNGGTTRPVRQTTPAPGIDMNRLAAQAQAQHKSVYMEFTAPWCHYCKRYQQEVLSTSTSQQALRNVIFVQPNFDREKPLARQYGVKAIPTGLLLKPQNGQLVVVGRHVGGLSQADLQKFLSR